MFLKMILFIACWLCSMAGSAQAADLSIACAANFTPAMKELITLYSKETGRTAECTYGSTGMLYGQIIKGAPYDLFLAADERRPAMLFDDGVALKPTLYAKGKVVLWSANELPEKKWTEVACSAAVHRVGIANPKTAPYGQRAVEAMATAHVYSKLEPKLVFGKSVGVSFQYAYSEAADISFVALSQALSSKGMQGTYWRVPQAGMVNQAGCILKNGRIQAASGFMEWLTHASTKAVIKKYGYE